MELTPRSRSPTSPFRYPSNSQPLHGYPSPAQSDSRYQSTDSLQGLGLYSCQMSKSIAEGGGLVTQSSSATSDWPTTGGQQHDDAPSSSRSTPNILSAEYDPFAPFHPSISAPYSHDIYTTHTAEVAMLPASPVPSGNASQRSSFSSAPASEIFAQAGPINSFTSRIKMEDCPEYVSGPDEMMISLPQDNHNILVSSAASFSGTLEAAFYQDQHPLIWPKMDYSPSHDLPSISSSPILSYGRRSESHVQDAPHTPRKIPSTIARTRQPRKLTTKEDANFQCTIRGCGKLFGRSYNFKAHMETHDARREYPFPCPMKNCMKRFVRKTDLQRHHQSVHMKQRNHRCDYCSRYFARKDTLRRHMEDGCSKRFDLETVDFKPQSYKNGNAMRGAASVIAENQSRQPSYSSTAHHSQTPDSTKSQDGRLEDPLRLAQSSIFETQEYLTESNTPESVWSS